MTVSTLTNRVVYAGNGSTTAFTVPFKVLDEDHLVVKRRIEATGVIDHTYIGTDYSYSGIGDDSGTLTLDGAALSSTYELVIERIVPYTQDLDIVNAGGFYPATVEEQLDLTTMQIQQVATQADDIGERSLMVPAGETTSVLPVLDDRAGMFLAFDAEGDPVASSGTGSDTALRTDLAAVTGATLIGWEIDETEAVTRTIEAKLRESISVLDFIPTALHAAIKAKTSTTDVSSYIQAAIDAIYANGGGTLGFPDGRYYCAAQITDKALVNWEGTGAPNCFLHWPASYTGHGVYQFTGLINAGGTGRKVVRGLSFESALGAASSTKAGYYDRGTHELTIEHCAFGGWEYGIVFDQTEEATIRKCALACTNGVWIANGEEAALGNTGASAQFTNQIDITHCKFTCLAENIVLDGGDGHFICFNNFNSGTMAVRAAGSTNFCFRHNYCEGMSGDILQFFSTTKSGGAAGACSTVEVANNLFAPSLSTLSAVSASSLGRLFFHSNLISGLSTADPAIVGGTNIAEIASCCNATDRAIIDARAQFINNISEYVIERETTTNVASIPAGTAAYVDVTVTGLGLGDAVENISTSHDLGDDIVLTARMSAANTARIRVKNDSGGAIDPANCTFRLLIRKRI